MYFSCYQTLNKRKYDLIYEVAKMIPKTANFQIYKLKFVKFLFDKLSDQLMTEQLLKALKESDNIFF